MSEKAQLFMRAFPAEIEQTGSRQLTGRLVPYGVVADVLDFLDDGRPDLYQEGFRRSAFDGQSSNSNKGVLTKIGLIHRHEGGLGYLGPCTGLRDEPDGLWGDIRVLPSKADDVTALLESGVDELSIEFRLRPGMNTEVDANGVRWRTRAHLDQIALEPKGAYRGAAVALFRSEVEEWVTATADQEHEHEHEDEEAAALEAVAAEALERRARWDALVGRLDGEQAKQRQMVEDYGITQHPVGVTDAR